MKEKFAALTVVVAIFFGSPTTFARSEAKPPTGLELRLISVAPTEYGATGLFELINDTGVPFTYVGYSAGNPGAFSTTEVRRWFRWKLVSIMGCGHGLQEFVLPSGQSITFPLTLYVGAGSSRHRYARARISEANGQFVVRSRPFAVPRYVHPARVAAAS